MTSDNHWLHTASFLLKDRPGATPAERDELMIANYRSVVFQEDTVYFLGDVFLKTDFKIAKSIMDRLPGTKHLVKGNHDSFTYTQYLRLGFISVVEECIIKVAGHRIRLSHFPRRPSWWARFRKKDARSLRYMDRRPPEDGLWILHGHTHSENKIDVARKSIHVGVDAWGFRPVSMSEIESLLSKHADKK